MRSRGNVRECSRSVFLVRQSWATRRCWPQSRWQQPKGRFGAWVGSTVGIVSADSLAIGVSALLGRKLPEKAVRIGAAALFVIFSGLLIVEGYTTRWPCPVAYALGVWAPVVDSVEHPRVGSCTGSMMWTSPMATWVAPALISRALTAAELVFSDGATQVFEADGGTRTHRENGRPARGEWYVDDDGHFGSFWPPSKPSQLRPSLDGRGRRSALVLAAAH